MASFDKGRIDFLGQFKLFGIISVVAVIVSLLIIGAKGFRYGIDFAGGTEVQVQFDKEVPVAEIRKFTQDNGFKNSSVQSYGTEREFLIRMESVVGKTDKETNSLLQKTVKSLTSALGKTFASLNPNIRRVDAVGPQIGSELKRKGLLAALYSLVMILIYIALRFDYKFAPSAVLCLFHDAIITLGIFALFGREVNVQTMAAILTIIGYSLNDTIVNFDRIRENLGLYKKAPLDLVINRSINDVLSRTILTSVTTLLAVLALYLLAGGVIEDFAFTLGIGIVIGTYSSIFVASPIVILTDKVSNMFAEKRTA